jgi:hypothetical protein
MRILLHGKKSTHNVGLLPQLILKLDMFWQITVILFWNVVSSEKY